MKKLNNYKYRYLILKEIAYSNPSKFTKPRDLEENFINEYGNIKIKINKISKQDKDYLLNHFKKKNEKLKNILSLKNQYANIINSLNN